MTSRPVRCLPVFLATLNVNEPLPVPLAADVMVNQEVPEVTLALQPQAESLAVIVTVDEPAASGTVKLVGVSVKLQPSACVAVNVRPAIVRVPVLAGPVFAATV
jgi:hypothetical protein